MARTRLAKYLNDHFAGSVAAVELLEYLKSVHADSPAGHLAGDLMDEVQADREELERLMRELDIPLSRPRQAAAWLGEKLAELKARLDDTSDGPLALLESAEVIALGIEGKCALWTALEAAARADASLAGRDYGRLQVRARSQHARIEELRLAAAVDALAPDE